MLASIFFSILLFLLISGVYWSPRSSRSLQSEECSRKTNRNQENRSIHEPTRTDVPRNAHDHCRAGNFTRSCRSESCYCQTQHSRRCQRVNSRMSPLHLFFPSPLLWFVLIYLSADEHDRAAQMKLCILFLVLLIVAVVIALIVLKIFPVKK